MKSPTAIHRWIAIGAAAMLAAPLLAVTRYVDGSVGSSGDGSSWGTAFKTIQEGLDSASSAGGGEVWVAAGIYYVYASSADDTVLLKTDVALYGGFAGDEDALGSRNWTANPTIIDGHQSEGSANQVQHVVTAADSATIDGFTITGGLGATGPPPARSTSPDAILSSGGAGTGAGLLVFQTNPTVNNCIFTGNSAGKGGAVYVMTATEFPPQSANPSPTFTGCVFRGNSAGNRGGGISIDLQTNPTFVRCQFIDNTCDAKGGGLYLDFGCSPLLVNCLFAGNTAERAAAVGCDGSSSPKFVNCTVTRNHAYDIGAGIYTGSYLQEANEPTLVNCIVWGNMNDEGGPVDLTVWHENYFTISHSDIGTGFTASGTGVLQDQDPLFVDPDNGDFRLQPGSPCLDTGIDSGTDADVPGDDLAGAPRSGSIDIGAFEGAVDTSTGSLTVTISPQAVIDAGAQWAFQPPAQRDAPVWHDSGETVADIPVGDYEVIFSAVSGWTTPAALPVTIATDATSEVTGTYTLPQLSVADVVVAEAAGSATVTVSITTAPASAVTVDYSTTAGTATAAVDFTAVSGQLSWSADDGAAKTFTITIIDDPGEESDETFTVTLTNPQNAIIGTAAGTVTITDDDGLTYPVVDTGQDVFYDNSTSITEPVAGEDFYGQDAHHDGSQPSYTVSGDSLTVYDNVTGLTWQKSPDVNGDGEIDSADAMDWAPAVAYADTLNAASFGGYSDWRLPTLKELYSLIDFRGTDPSSKMGSDTSGLTAFIDTAAFDFAWGDTANGKRLIDAQYWSSTECLDPILGGTDGAYGVNFADGRIKGYEKIADLQPIRYVRYVRGPTTYGVNDFVDNGNGTITDRATGLMWAQDDSGSGRRWKQALAWVATQNSDSYLGYSDWRLPNAKELQSLVDYSRAPLATGSACISTIFNITSITNLGGETDWPYFWTSTTHVDWEGGASTGVYLAFGKGLGYWEDQYDDVHGAGCQRSDPKTGLAENYPQVSPGAPQGDVQRVLNYVRLVRDFVSGSLTVTISPQEAIDAGAQWQLDGGAWQDSGATLTQIEVGSHTLSYAEISGWDSPASVSVTISEAQVMATTGTYALQPRSLTVTISPQAASDAGAQWQVDDGALQDSGATVGDLTVGTHTVSFSDVSGWVTPASATATIAADQPTTMTATYTAAFAGGSGTEGDPYQVSTVEQLQRVGEYLSSHFVLVNDIAMDAEDAFEPIGSTSSPFSGVFDGQDYVIELALNRPTENYVALFGFAGSTAAIRNVYLTGAVVGKNNTAALAGECDGTVTDCHAAVSVEGNNYVGGLVALSDGGSLTRCHVAGSVTGVLGTGGLVAVTDGTFSATDCYCSGAVSGDDYVAGVHGVGGDSLVRCYASGVVSGNSNVGGVSGYQFQVASACYYDAARTGQSDSNGATAKTTAEMQTQSTFSGWDFDSTWIVHDGQSRPYLTGGALNVSIADSGVAAAGAKWRLDGGEWRDSGDSIEGLRAGSYTVSYLAVDNYDTPPDETVTIADSTLTTATGTYVVHTGTLTVTIEPQAAIDAGAQWQLDDGDLHDSGTLTDVTVGDHALAFVALSGWDTPASQTVTVGHDLETTTTGTYVQQLGSITVTLGPAEALAAGARWRVDDGAWYASGATASDLPVGSHTISYDGVKSWEEPASESVALAKDDALEISRTYVMHFAGGSGTSGDPYQIGSYDQLQNMDDVQYLADSFVLTDDVSYSSARVETNFDPIGSSTLKFTGSFDGQGHTVDLIITRSTEDYVGLFARVGSGGEVYDLTVGGTVAGGDECGALAGFNEGTISRCQSTAAVSGGADVGGLVGVTHGAGASLSSSFASGTVTGDEDTGGLCGDLSQGTIENCYASGAVTGGYWVGGLLGFSYQGTLSNCYAAGAVSGTDDLGGLLGLGLETTVSSCYYDSETSGRSDTGKGEPRTTAALMQAATFSGWDLSEVWTLHEDVAYPYLTGGALTVALSPAGAITAGAQWQIVGGELLDSGTAITALPAGNYSVVFSEIADWDAPAPQNLSITDGELTEVTGTYLQHTGSIAVTIGPDAAAAAGAQWYISDYAPQDGGAAMTGVPVGTYTLGFTTVSGWYTPAEQAVTIGNGETVSLTVTYEAKVALTISADDVTRRVEQPNPDLTVTYSGLLESDTPESLGLEVAIVTAADENSAAGTYAITASGPIETADYVIEYVAGTLTVLARDLPVISWGVDAITYGKALGAAQRTATVAGDLPGTLIYDFADGTLLHAGTHTLSVTFTPEDTVNYDSATATVELVVDSVPLTVTTVDASKTYGEENPDFTVEYTEFVGADDAAVLGGSLAFATAADALSSVGDYDLTPSGLTSTDYDITFVAGTLTVEAAAMTVRVDNTSKIYGEANPDFTLSYDSFVAGDTADALSGEAVFATTATAASSVGPYTVTVSGLTSTNYAISFAAGTLTIDPAVLTVKADNASRTYGQANPAFTVSYDGFAGGEDEAVLSGTLAFATTATRSSPAASYEVTPSGLTGDNYALDFVVGTLTVGKAPLTITADDVSRRIGQPNPGLTATYAGLVNDDQESDLGISITLNCDATEASPADTYPITVSGPNASTNYSIGYVAGTLTVEPLLVPVISWSDPPAITYGTALGETQLDAVADVPGTFDYDPAPGSVLGVGGHTLSVTFTPTDTVNYTTATASVSLTVETAALTVTTVAASRLYGAANPEFSVQYSGFAAGDDASDLDGDLAFSTAATPASNAGQYAVSPSGLTSANYALSFVAGTLTVTRAPLAVSGVDATRREGQPNPAFAADYDGLVGDDTAASLGITVTTSTSATAASPPASYAIVVSGPETSTNYAITYSNGTLTVLAREVPSITWPTPAAITYGTALDSTQLNAQAGVAGSFVYDPVAGTVLHAGTRTLRVTFTPDDAVNYSTATAMVSLLVEPATLTVTAVNASRVYGVGNPAFSVTYDSFVNGDTAAVLSNDLSFATDAVASSPVDTYTVTPGGLSSDDYDISFVAGMLTVTRAALTVTAQDASRRAGEPNPAFSAAYTGLASFDDVADLGVEITFSTDADTGSQSGTYPIVPSGPATSTNYTITYLPGTLTVTDKQLPVITWTAPAAITYGTALDTVQLNAEADTAGSFVYTPDTGTIPHAGQVTLTATFTPEDSVNFASTTATVGLEVLQAPLTVSAVSTERLYGAANPAFSISYDGFIEGDDEAVLSGDPTFTTAAVRSSPVDTYTVTPGGLSASDYAISFVAGTLAVTRAPLIIAAADAVRRVGQANPTFSLTYSGLVNSDEAGDLNITVTVSTEATEASPPASYEIVSAGPETSTNYALSYAAGTLTVLAREVPAIEWATPAAIVYGTALSGTQLNAGADVPGTFTYDPASGAVLHAGTRTLTAMFVPDDAGNYASTSAEVMLTVMPADLTVRVEAAARTYGGENPAFAATTTGFITGEDAGVLGGTLAFMVDADSRSPANTYEVSAGGLSSDDYAITYVAGVLTVNRAALTIRANDASRTVGQASPVFTVAYEGLVNDDQPADLGIDVALTTGATAGSPAGIYPIVPSGPATSANYSISYVAGQLEITAQALPEISWPTPTAITYGAALSGDQLNAQADVAGTFTYSPVAGTVLRAGDRRLNVTFAPADGELYAVTTASVMLTVSRAPLIVTAQDVSRAYGSEDPAFSAAFDRFVNDDNESVLGGTLVLAAEATAASSPDTYDIVASGLTSNDYEISYVSGRLTVTKAALTIRADDVARREGQTNPMLSLTYDGLVLEQLPSDVGVEVTLSTTADTASAPGPYAITVAGPAESANYTISYEPGTLTVLARESVPITWATPAAIAYGTALSGTQLDAAAEIAGEFSYAPAAGAVLHAGNRQLTATFVPADQVNFQTTLASVTLVVEPAALTVTAVDATRPYGGDDPAFEVAYDGFVADDDAGVLAGELQFTTVATSTSDVGDYTLTPRGLSSSDYVVTFVAGKLAVTRASLTVMADDVSRLFGLANPELTASYIGLVAGDQPGDLGLTVALDTGADASSPVGTYAITVAGPATTTNYAVRYVPGELSVLLEMTLDLQPGWNQVSLPFAVVAGAEEVFVDDSASLLIGGTAWRWDAIEQAYVAVTGSLPAKQGLWVYCTAMAAVTTTTIAGLPEALGEIVWPGWNLLGPAAEMVIGDITGIDAVHDVWRWNAVMQVAQLLSADDILTVGSVCWLYVPGPSPAELGL